MSWEVLSSFDLKFKEAEEWFRSRVPLTDDEYATLEGAARRRAFTVAGVAQLDLVAQVFDQIGFAIETGTDFKTFKQELTSSLQNAWGTDKKITGYKLERIYRTNIQTAYGAGRYAQLTNADVLKARPYWMFDAVMDKRTSGLCSSLNGTVLPVDDPWWNGKIPPLHHSCRSGLRSLTTKAATTKGITSSPSKLIANEGFGGKPTESEWEPDWATYPPALQDEYRKHVLASIAPLEPVDKIQRARRKNLESARAYMEAQGVRAEISTVAFEIALDKRDRLAPGMHWQNTTWVNRSSTWWDDPTKAAQDQFADGWISTNDPRHLEHHELGHAAHQLSAPKTYRRLKLTPEENVFTAEDRAAVKASLSDYGAETKTEMIAEVYAALQAGKKLEDYPEIVRSWYAILGGPTP